MVERVKCRIEGGLAERRALARCEAVGLLVTVLGAKERPDKSTEFPGDGNGDLVAMEASGQEFEEASVEAVLGLPAQVADGRGLILLASGEFLADFGG